MPQAKPFVRSYDQRIVRSLTCDINEMHVPFFFSWIEHLTTASTISGKECYMKVIARLQI
jgi:hypothetical protein